MLFAPTVLYREGQMPTTILAVYSRNSPQRTTNDEGYAILSLDGLRCDNFSQLLLEKRSINDLRVTLLIGE